MAADKGNVPSDKGAAPFATRDGKPTAAASTRTPADYWKTPNGNPQGGGGRDFIAEGSRPQQQPPAKVPEPVYRGNPHLVSRPQTAGNAAQRLGGVQNLPKNGTRADVPPTTAPAWRAGTGSVDPDGRPMGAPPFRLGDAGAASASSGSAGSASSHSGASSNGKAAEVLARLAHQPPEPFNRKR